jgi:translation initiation factor 2 beta subunit (eIF-2beta)/eIF-5
MIKLLILHIINKFISNSIELNSNGLYSFKSDVQRSHPKIEAKSNLTCLKILEETLKEINYLKRDAEITREEICKIIVEMENISSESIILLMSFLKNSEQTDNNIDKLNNLLISNFHTNDIDFYIGILLETFSIKSQNINNLARILTDFKSMLCFLTDTPFGIDTSVGIYNDILVDDNINIVKTYKIKYKKNSIDLNSTREDECFDAFYVDPEINPIRRTKPANVFLKAGWERTILKQLEMKGVIKKTANWIYNDLMYLVGKSKDTQEVYFKNEPMCQRRWTNDEIQNDDKWEAYFDGEEYIDDGEDVFNLYDPEVTDDTDTNSDLYKNNEILKKIWFYSDDLFPVQPHKSPLFNILDRRAEFAFKTLKVQNKDIFKSSPFNKEDLHIILPILWLYKIYDEYRSIASNVQTDNNIELLFNYFKPEDMLVYLKRHILLENNTFDLETLSFLIILSALSKMTSLLIDDRVIKKKNKRF